MESVRAQYAELKSVMARFEVSVRECVAKAESEFLQAYRSHMVEVHRELAELRESLAESQRSVEGDESIQRLEAETAWFREEAGQLAGQIATMDKERRRLVEVLAEVSAERGALTHHVKALKKQYKLKRAALSVVAGLEEEKEELLPSGVSSSQSSWLKTRPADEAEIDDCDLIKERIKSLQRAHGDSQRRAAHLRRTLVTERAEMGDLEERFKACLEAARFEADRGRLNDDAAPIDLDHVARLGKLMFPAKSRIARCERLLSTAKAASLLSSASLPDLATAPAPAPGPGSVHLNPTTLDFLRRRPTSAAAPLDRHRDEGPLLHLGLDPLAATSAPLLRA